MPGKKGQHTRRLKGGANKKKLQETRNALNKELVELRKEKNNANKRGANTQPIDTNIELIMATKKNLNRLEEQAVENAVSTPDELNAAAKNLNAKEAANAAAKEAANAAAKEVATLASTPAEENGSSNNGSNNANTYLTENNADNCPTIEADDFKTQTHLGANFLSLYGCFMLEGNETSMINPSGFLLQLVKDEITLNNKAEAVIYLYISVLKYIYSDILNSDIPGDKKVKKLIIRRENITRRLIHYITYYALLCSDDTDNDMVKVNRFSIHSSTNLNSSFMDDIMNHYFPGKTVDYIMETHFGPLFSIENIEKLANKLFESPDNKNKVIRLEILEQNAYSTVLQSFMEIEEQFVYSDLPTKLLDFYIGGEENLGVLKYFKAELREGLKDKKVEDVLYNDILYSITISPVRYTSLREMAKDMLTQGPKPVTTAATDATAAPAAPTESSSCETDRDLCLGTDAHDESCKNDRDLCLGTDSPDPPDDNKDK